jgi:hypothetical protein
MAGLSKPEVRVMMFSDFLGQYVPDRQKYDSEMMDNDVISFLLLDIGSKYDSPGMCGKTMQCKTGFGVGGIDSSDLYIVRFRPGQIISVGRSAGNILRLMPPDISKDHAYFRSTTGTVDLEDQSSTYGTFRKPKGGNDWEKMNPHSRIKLSDEDGIRFAQHATFTFRYPREFWDYITLYNKARGTGKGA